MLTSLLYHALELTTQRHLRTEYESCIVIFHSQSKSDKIRCSYCGSRQVIKRGGKIHDFCKVPVGLKPVLVRATIQRLTCQCRGLTRQQKKAIADEKNYTHGFRRFVSSMH